MNIISSTISYYIILNRNPNLTTFTIDFYIPIIAIFISTFIFNELLPSEDKTCEGVVRTLTKAKELTYDTYTIDACNRAITGLIKGDIEPDDEDKLDEYLLWHHMNMEEHLSEILYDVIQGDLSFEFYKENLDGYLNSIEHTNTDEVVYICTGNSITERAAYNRAHTQDTRRVELLPDEYANVLVHTITDYLNHDICDASEIKPYVEELLRIGNSACYNINLATKYYLKNSQPYTAIKLCKNGLKYSLSKQDAAIYAYLAAYASWQAGDIKTATGLYLLAQDSNTIISKQARNELSDLISEYPEYKEAKTEDIYKYIRENGWATNLQESYELTDQIPPTDVLTYDALMKTGIIYAADEGVYDLADQFIPEQLDKKTDLMAAIARSLI